jgi:fatty-acid peroxygenase
LQAASCRGFTFEGLYCLPFGGAFSFIPYGEGEYHKDHRCGGEGLTIELIKVALLFLTKDILYRVPAQDLSMSLMRIPTMPKSWFVMEQVKGRAASD